jgi:hypothetical protein
LQDLSQTVCILGPDLYGSRVPFVALSNPPITSTVSTPTATPLVTPRNQATDENWLKGNTLFILLLSLLIIGILFSICLYFYRKKHTKYRPTVETIRSPSVDTIIRVETEPQLTTFAKQLIQDPHQVIVQERISVDSNEYQSFKSTSYQSSSFISAEDGFKSSLESGSFKTAEEYFTDSGSEQSIDLDIDELFDDKASTVTIKGL